MPPDSGKKPTTVRLSAEAQRLLEKMAEKNGISKTAVLELAIRKMAEKEGVE